MNPAELYTQLATQAPKRETPVVEPEFEMPELNDAEKQNLADFAESVYKQYEDLPMAQQLGLAVAPVTGEAISAYETKKFAEEIDLNHREIKITPKTFADNWENSIKYIEEPRYNWCLPMYFFSNRILLESISEYFACNLGTSSDDLSSSISSTSQSFSHCNFISSKVIMYILYHKRCDFTRWF